MASDTEKQLLQLCTNGNLPSLKDFITKQQLNANGVKDSSGLTLLHLACQHGHLDIAQYFIKDQNCSPETTTPNGRTPLHIACKSGHLHIAKYLITDHKCNPHCTDNDGYTSLHAASESGNIETVKYLITEQGCDPQVSDSIGNTPLHYASESGHLDIVQCLIEDFNCDPQKTNGRGSIPLHLACKGGQTAVARYLIKEHQCSPNYTNMFGNTLLHMACLSSCLPLVKNLIDEHGCNPHSVDNDGLTPLHFACLDGHLDITKYLISDCNCNPQCTDNNDFTPLHCACQNGHLEVAKHLITEHKCNPEHGDVAGFTPLHSAASNGHLAVVKYLISELGCNPQIADNNDITPLHFACLDGHLDITKYLISDCNCNPQCTDNNDFTPLHCACQNGHLEVAKHLITEHKCNPEHGDVDGFTPLHSAASNGHLAVVKYLISELGCNPQIADNNDITPLHFACLDGHLDITKYLISDCNCNPQCFTNNGDTPLHYACEKGHLEVAKNLITAHKCSPEHGNVSGFTPLHLAVFTGHLAVVKYLISECGCNSQITDNAGHTPLHYACYNGHLDITKYLISDCNCNPQCSDKNGFTPLHFACQNGHLEVVKYLITEHKCNPEHGNVNGFTPLHSAASNGHLAVVKYLISELGCNPQILSNSCGTPLHYACLKGQLDIAKYLISDCNCNPQCSDKNGNTLLHCACQNGHLEITKYLITKQKCSPEHANVSGISPFLSAARFGHLAVVKYLITQHHCNPQYSNADGITPLHSACGGGHLHVVKYLLHEQHCACEPKARINYGMILSKLGITQQQLTTVEPFLLLTGVTPLHFACMEGHLDIVKYLIDLCKCNPNQSTSHSLTAIDFAQRNGHQEVVNYLRNEHQCTSSFENFDPLLPATLTGDLETVKACTTKSNCNPLTDFARGLTPLHTASMVGHLEIAKYLISEHKYSPEHGNVDGLTPLHVAAHFGHLAVVKYFISELGCNSEIADSDGDAPLHCACQNGHLKLVKYLITEHNCSPEHGNVDGYTPLHSAARNGHLAVVKYLIGELGCNSQITDNDGFTPLHYACLNGHLDITKYLISECNCNPECLTDSGFSPLHHACRKGHLEIAKYLIAEHNCSPEHSNVDGITPLHLAASKGHLAVVKYLITQHNCNPQCCDNDGITPLHITCGNGHLHVAKYLIDEQNCACDSEARINATTRLQKLGFTQQLLAAVETFLLTEGVTPLDFACMEGHLDIVKYLISVCRCNPNHSASIGLTAIDWAQLRGCQEVVSYLKNEHQCSKSLGQVLTKAISNVYGVNSDYFFEDLNDIYFSPLDEACITGNLQAVKSCLTESNWNPSSTSFLGTTPLQIACMMGHLQIAEYLITEHKCNPEHCTVDGFAALYLGAFSGNLAVVRYLITQCNCNPQCSNINGYTPLHAACISGHLHVVKYLIHEQHCAHEPEARVSDKAIQLLLPPVFQHFEVELRVFNGITPLHLACEGGHIDIVKHLIDVCNCNPNHPTSNGLTAIDFAQRQGQQEVVTYLRDEHQCSLGLGQLVSSAASHFLTNFYGLNIDCLELDYNDLLVSKLQRACVTGNLAVVKTCATKSDCNSTTGLLGLTPLHTACMMGHLEIVKYLINEFKCDPNCVCTSTYFHDVLVSPLTLSTFLGQFEVVRWLVGEQKCEPVYFDCELGDNIPLLLLACQCGHLGVVKYLLSDSTSTSQDLEIPDLLCLACWHGHLDVCKHLIEEFKCNPLFRDDDGITPLHFACVHMQYFNEKEHHISAMRSIHVHIMQGILHVLLAIINLPVKLLSNVLSKISPGFSSELSTDDTTSEGKQQPTSYNLRCLDIVKYLITEHKCNPQCEDKEGQTPLHYACAGGQLEIVQYFYSEKLSDLAHTTHSGDTPLHFACKDNQVEVVHFLLSTGECDPMIKNAKGQTSVEIATSPEIMEQLDHFCQGKYPLESVVKVFVLGDPMAGKSSLVQAIQSNSGFLSSLIGQFRKVKGVRHQTAGIDSFSFSSSEFGNVVIYDFAGQREFYTTHAAFLQNLSSHMPGIFIVVTNIFNCEGNIHLSLHYWVSFIQECCAHMPTETKSHILVIGSHADQLDKGGVEQAYTLIQKCFTEHLGNWDEFYEKEGIICLDCTRPSSPGLDLLRYHLVESCNSIRQNREKIDQRCYVLHKYVKKEYVNIGIHGSKLENISKDLEDNANLLPSTSNELLPLFQTLHDTGQVIFLRNKRTLGDSWVITNVAAMLETVVGSIFAPRDFPHHIAPGSTGIVPKSRISEAFPDLNIDMVIGFLEHFEFCHRVGLDLVKVIQSKHQITDDECYLFPALVTSQSVPQVVQESYESSYCCGWLYFTAEGQFFTTRFLHVLLLRLVFQLTVPQDNVMPTVSAVQTPALKQSCTMWKSGITWHDMNGVATYFEVRDLKTVILIMSSMKGSEIHFVRLRTQLIKAILRAKKEFCPRVDAEECIMEVEIEKLLQAEQKDPSQNTKYSLKYLSDRISTRDASDHQDLLLVNPDGSPGKRIAELLYFEPYTLLTSDLITQMFSKENSDLLLNDAFISELAGRLYFYNDILAQILKLQPRILIDRFKHDTNVLDSLDEISKQLRCEHILEAWMDQCTSPATYRKLRQELNKYSIFCGRNPLDLSRDEDVNCDFHEQHLYSSNESDESSADKGGDSVERGNGSREDNSSQINQTDQPTLIECVRFRGRERRINIPQEIGIQFYDFSKFLLEDDTGARTRSIAYKHRDDAEQINMEVLRQWINGRGKQPITWKTLTEVLHDIELNTLAGDIEAVKCHEETIVQIPIGISDDPVEGDQKGMLTAKSTEESKQSSSTDVHTEKMEDVNYTESLEQMVDIVADLLSDLFDCEDLEDSEKQRSLLDRNFEAELLAIDSEDSNEKKENQRTSVLHGTGRRTDTRSSPLIQDEELD